MQHCSQYIYYVKNPQSLIFFNFCCFLLKVFYMTVCFILCQIPYVNCWDNILIMLNLNLHRLYIIAICSPCNTCGELSTYLCKQAYVLPNNLFLFLLSAGNIFRGHFFQCLPWFLACHNNSTGFSQNCSIFNLPVSNKHLF